MKPLVQKFSLTFLSFSLLFILTGFVPKSSYDKPTSFNKLTVKSLKKGEGKFDLMIFGRTTDGKIFTFSEKGLKTPYETELDLGQYTIVVNTVNKKVESKITYVKNSQQNGSASSNDETVLLIIEKPGHLVASGM